MAVSAELVADDDEIVLITNSGRLVRTTVDEVSIQSRNTHGVRLVTLGNDETLVSFRLVEDANDNNPTIVSELDSDPEVSTNVRTDIH